MESVADISLSKHSTSSDKQGNISPDGLSAHFVIDNPNHLEVKIEVKIDYRYDDELELKFSDNTEKINFGIDYGSHTIADSKNVGDEYESSQNMLWIKYPIKLDKTKLYINS